MPRARPEDWRARGEKTDTTGYCYPIRPQMSASRKARRLARAGQEDGHGRHTAGCLANVGHLIKYRDAARGRIPTIETKV
eukprot:scaffold243230_cov31-Tisochrysis_lutea.AAC.1